MIKYNFLDLCTYQKIMKSVFYLFTKESLSLKPLVFSVEIKFTELNFALYQEDDSNVDSSLIIFEYVYAANE